MSSFLFAFLLASLCALVVHEITWVLRYRALELLRVIGALALTAYGCFGVLGLLWVVSEGKPKDICLVLLWGASIVLVCFLLGRLHKKHLSCGIWDAMLAVWAEASLYVGLGFCVFHYIVNRKLQNAWPIAGFDYFHWESWFEVSLAACFLLLSTTRPFRERMIKELWQIVRDWFRLK